ncbi:response regulator transcription factor [Paenibacillus sp. JX-17]|uniref:Response regulator transcription factor n=1 Tax=Paenibacillus lacisoli TaxID=3064525 RepID=A0ABT9CFB2_9BACL|nr:response regulator transcription factor [Paenibacillus sp. JX-17]MDO7907891.1 response regulator transcription factor [Paenibacillus sp. JX-17]
MFKVLIADDEPMIREGLASIMEWEELGYSVAATAANGREALQKYQEVQPDLIIIDIRMPGMTGLEVIRELRQSGASVHFIILSGYADFDYAKEAITMGVNSYLLKPVDEDEMKEELLRIHTMLVREQNNGPRQVQEEMIYRDHLVEALLFSSESLSGDRDPAVQLNLNWPSYQVILLELLNENGSDSLAEAAVKRRISELFDLRDRGILFSAGYHVGILLREPVYGTEAARLLSEELTEAASTWGYRIFGAAGESVTDLHELTASYAVASRLLSFRFLYREQRLMLPQDLSVLESSVAAEERAGDEDSDQDPVHYAEKLYYALDIVSLEAVKRVLAEMKDVLPRYYRTEQSLKNGFAQVFSLAMNKLSASQSGRLDTLQDTTALLSEVYRQPTLDCLVLRAEEQLSQLISHLGGSSKDIVLKQMVDFIRRNYSENLKLELLAEIFNYNSGYLGKLFKSHTGESFNAFLDKVRIENAKELLSQGLKVHQVAERVGYGNVDYFHSKFKRYVGSSPSSYRDHGRG